MKLITLRKTENEEFGFFVTADIEKIDKEIIKDILLKGYMPFGHTYFSLNEGITLRKQSKEKDNKDLYLVYTNLEKLLNHLDSFYINRIIGKYKNTQEIYKAEVGSEEKGGINRKILMEAGLNNTSFIEFYNNSNQNKSPYKIISEEKFNSNFYVINDLVVIKTEDFMIESSKGPCIKEKNIYTMPSKKTENIDEFIDFLETSTTAIEYLHRDNILCSVPMILPGKQEKSPKFRISVNSIDSYLNQKGIKAEGLKQEKFSQYIDLISESFINLKDQENKLTQNIKANNVKSSNIISGINKYTDLVDKELTIEETIYRILKTPGFGQSTSFITEKSHVIKDRVAMDASYDPMLWINIADFDDEIDTKLITYI